MTIAMVIEVRDLTTASTAMVVEVRGCSFGPRVKEDCAIKIGTQKNGTHYQV